MGYQLFVMYDLYTSGTFSTLAYSATGSFQGYGFVDSEQPLSD